MGIVVHVSARVRTLLSHCSIIIIVPSLHHWAHEDKVRVRTRTRKLSLCCCEDMGEGEAVSMSSRHWERCARQKMYSMYVFSPPLHRRPYDQCFIWATVSMEYDCTILNSTYTTVPVVATNMLSIHITNVIQTLSNKLRIILGTAKTVWCRHLHRYTLRYVLSHYENSYKQVRACSNISKLTLVLS